MRELTVDELENVSGGFTLPWILKALGVGIVLHDGAKDFFEGFEEGFKDGQSKKPEKSC
jgi:bacteriocin-like protein